MRTLITAALDAAAPVPSGADAHAQHQQQGQAAHEQMMDHNKMMADCKKCCEEMEGKHADTRSEHDEHAHQ